MKNILRILQKNILKLTLQSTVVANIFGQFLLTLAGFGVGLESITGSIYLFHSKTITLQLALIVGGTVGAALTRFSVKHPEKLQAMLDTLNTQVPTDHAIEIKVVQKPIEVIPTIETPVPVAPVSEDTTIK